MTRRMLAENPGLEFALVQIFSRNKPVDKWERLEVHLPADQRFDGDGQIQRGFELLIVCQYKLNGIIGSMTAAHEGEVTEAAGDFRVGEVIPLTDSEREQARDLALESLGIEREEIDPLDPNCE
jgi:hypothetical protein